MLPARSAKISGILVSLASGPKGETRLKSAGAGGVVRDEVDYLEDLFDRHELKLRRC
jgi:hypothetical protein